MRKNKLSTRIVCSAVIVSFLGSAVFPVSLKASGLGLPSPAQFVNLSPAYSFPILKGLKFDPANPLKMEFIIDTADKKDISQEEASLLIKYFLAGLTTAEQDVWVNLSPYEQDRIIPETLSQTDLGKDLLSQDYLLKQLMASLTYPESDTGKDFWSKTYAEVLKIAQTTNLPVNTFNKVWIVPEEAEVYENGNSGFITKATLKAMLEEDYLALKNKTADIQKEKKGLDNALIEKINQAASGVMKETVLPKITKDINSGKNFATLRQIYHSLILGMWFKKKFKESLYQYYIDQGKIKGIDLEDKTVKEKIYRQYVEAFKNGLYNYIKADYDPPSRKNIKRRYYSGGFSLKTESGSSPLKVRTELPIGKTPFSGPTKIVTAEVIPTNAGSGAQAGSPLSNKEGTAGLSPEQAEAVKEWLSTYSDNALFGPNPVLEKTLYYLKGTPVISYAVQAGEPKVFLPIPDALLKLFQEKNIMNIESRLLGKIIDGFYPPAIEVSLEQVGIDPQTKKPQFKLIVQNQLINRNPFIIQSATRELVKHIQSWLKSVDAELAEKTEGDKERKEKLAGATKKFEEFINALRNKAKDIHLKVGVKKSYEYTIADSGYFYLWSKIDELALFLERDYLSAFKNRMEDIKRRVALDRATNFRRIPFIGGNWKMEIATVEEARNLLLEIAGKVKDITGVEIVIAPSPAQSGFVSLALKDLEEKGETPRGVIKIAAQNIAGMERGALTGGTSILQVKGLGASYAIIGHSEQRRNKKQELDLTENASINAKVELALKNGIIPIICVGESLVEREAGKIKSVVEDMIRKAFVGLTPEQAAKSIIAYGPVWAIGTGKVATSQQAEEVLRFIRGIILDMFDEDAASKVRIIYGGSVKPDNIAGLLDKSVIPDNDGALVGGASLKGDSFAAIVHSAVPEKSNSSSPISTTSIPAGKLKGDKFEPIYYFGNYGQIDAGLPKGGAKDKELLGGKGANLAEMANYISKQFPELGLNVPPGFTITTEQTKNWDARGKVLSDELKQEMLQAIHRLEEAMQRTLGNTKNLPLLVAVRSGAEKSMPGMMDTILNLGLNPESVLALARATNERFAWDSYRRFIEMYGRTVLGTKEDDEKRTGFKHILKEMVSRQEGRKSEYELSVAELKELVGLYKQEIQRQSLPAIPENPYEQYRYAVEAVFRSSFNERAMIYRAKEGLKLEETLSAVNVMPMVFGNLNERSGAGVAFSRDLQTGEKRHNLEYNIFCQGEDVVAGRKKGLPLEELEKQFPEVARSLKAILAVLEEYYKDVQDVEFTIEDGKLWILQARSAKRTSRSEVKTAMDMYAEGLLKTPEGVLALITADKMIELLVPQFDKEDKQKALAEKRLLSDGGLNASPGAGMGRIVFDSDRATKLKEKIDDIRTRITNNEEVTDEERDLARVGIILVRDETSPDDLDGMLASEGIWTRIGGRTSHAAVVARQFGIAAVVGDDNIEIDVAAKTVTIIKADGTKQALKEGDIVSLDGAGEKGRGQIFIGEIKTVPSFVTTAQYKENLEPVRRAVKRLQEWKEDVTGEQAQALRREYDKHIKIYQEHIAKYERAQLTQDEWDFYRQYQALHQLANKVRKEHGGLGVGANAEKPLDVLNAVLNGAENFGLVRTEHMFSGGGRELKFQKMILAETEEERKEALRELLPLQQVDFEQIFIFADGKPVTIRLIDPPLHEFLPKKEEKIKELADALGLDIEEVKRIIDKRHEENPMFGTRGVRLSIIFSEIIEMQVKAIFNAVNKAMAAGIQVELQIMVPLVGNVKEILFVKQRIEEVAKESGVKRDSFQIGTMIEIVAGAMNIAEIAKVVDFISFGTNDFTQGVVTISRDDGKEWLRKSLATEIFEDDPFVTLSPEVSLFMKRVIEQARAANPKIKIGICGEQGVDVKSINKYLAPYGLNYVSGGPRRIPGALIAAAQESIKGYKPLEPKAREEVRIEKKKFPELASIKEATTLAGQCQEAVVYVKQKGNTQEAKEAALANIDLIKPVDADIQSDTNYKEVLLWAKELKALDVTIRADKSEGKTGAIVGMIETESFFFDNGELRFEIQKLLLDNDVSEYERQNQMNILKKHFVSYLKNITTESRVLSIKLPDFALGTIFEYETKEDQEATIGRLAASLGIEEKEVKARITPYREANRAIGTRGMRAFFLRNAAPLYMAIAQAALIVAKENGIKNVDFILPFLVNGKELGVVLNGYKTDKGETVIPSLREALKGVQGAEDVNYRFGAVIETPAACVTAKDLTIYADFFVVDAKKLTEAVWAAFEGDTRKGFFDAYRKSGIWDRDIFKYAPKEVSLLIQEAVSTARARNDLEVRVITDSLDADLIELSQHLGVNSLIVRPGEVDIATLAVAQAAIKFPRQKGETASSPIVYSLEPEIVYDSRGKQTVKVVLRIGDLEVTGDVPAGASKGEDEARTVDVGQAIKNIREIILPLLQQSGLDLSKHQDLIAMERLLIEKAGDNFKDLGANATVPVSRALWKMAAKLQGMELWEYIRKYEPETIADNPNNMVYPLMNIYNGGLHALKKGDVLGEHRIAIQEIMIVSVGAKSQKEALEMGDRIDYHLQMMLLDEYSAEQISRADEAGFSVKGLGDSDKAIGYVFKAIKKAGYEPGRDVKLSLDVAATSFFKKETGRYSFQGKELASEEMIAYYAHLAKKYSGMIFSIEDGLAENDWEGWQKLTQKMKEYGIRTIGDDLFVTQLERLNKGIENQSATDVLIKVNQNGTMYGTLEVIKRAKKAGMGWIVSHRSGETLDTSIADLAYATNALGLKAGDPQPDYDYGEGGPYQKQPLVRRVKYRRMVEIEEGKNTAASPLADGAVVEEVSPAPYSNPGGIDMQGINVDAAPSSSPVNMAVPFGSADFTGFSFRIIKMEELKKAEIWLDNL